MPKFYQVKPEFDQQKISIKIPDKRHKNGYRIEFFHLVGGELIDEKIHTLILEQYKYKSDFFIERELSKKQVGCFFGCGFADDYVYDPSFIDYAVKFHNKLAKEAFDIYKSYKLKTQEKSNPDWITFLILISLSIETLQEVINYYKTEGEKL